VTRKRSMRKREGNTRGRIMNKLTGKDAGKMKEMKEVAD